jgi:hypothetical protein
MFIVDDVAFIATTELRPLLPDTSTSPVILTVVLFVTSKLILAVPCVNKLPTIFRVPPLDIVIALVFVTAVVSADTLPTIFNVQFPVTDKVLTAVVELVVMVEFMVTVLGLVVVIVKHVVVPDRIPIVVSVHVIVRDVEHIKPPPATAGDCAVVLKVRTVTSWSIVTVKLFE